MREKRDPALIRGEPLVEEIAPGIRRDDPDIESPASFALETEPGTSSSDRTAEPTGAEDRLAILRPVGPLHLDLGRASVNTRSPLPSAFSTATGDASCHACPNARTRASRRPATSSGLASLQSVLDSSSRSCPSLTRSFPQLVAAGPDRPIGDLRAVGARVEVHFAGAAVADRIRFAGDAPVGWIERERPQPRPARRRREDAVSCRPATGPRSSLLPRRWSGVRGHRPMSRSSDRR